jgi:hypothetical protein
MPSIPPTDDDRFDPARVGLDHVGFGCADADAVAAWRDHLDAAGIEHSGIAGPTRMRSC